VAGKCENLTNKPLLTLLRIHISAFQVLFDAPRSCIRNGNKPKSQAARPFSVWVMAWTSTCASSDQPTVPMCTAIYIDASSSRLSPTYAIIRQNEQTIPKIRVENRHSVTYVTGGHCLWPMSVLIMKWPRINRQFMFHQMLGPHQP
jgi:hypothetical protein